MIKRLDPVTQIGDRRLVRLILEEDDQLILLFYGTENVPYIDRQQSGTAHYDHAGSQDAYRRGGHHTVDPGVDDPLTDQISET